MRKPASILIPKAKHALPHSSGSISKGKLQQGPRPSGKLRINLSRKPRDALSRILPQLSVTWRQQCSFYFLPVCGPRRLTGFSSSSCWLSVSNSSCSLPRSPAASPTNAPAESLISCSCCRVRAMALEMHRIKFAVHFFKKHSTGGHHPRRGRFVVVANLVHVLQQIFLLFFVENATVDAFSKMC